jgi:peptidoglycan/xylan/chitin deacetylase (PgdA/CDA1 family)
MLGIAAAAVFPGPALAVTTKKVPLPPVQGRLPVPPVTVDHPPVDQVTSFDNGPRGYGKVALTFDADMTPGMLQQLRSGQVRSWYNQEVRDVVEAEHVPATIFLTGLWAQTYPDVARSLARDPLFEIGSHTHDHAAFRTPCYGLAGTADRAGEILTAEREIQDVTGVAPALLRFPGDCYDASDVALARSLGMTVISGDVRGGDGFNNSAAVIAATVLRNVQPGSIVLLHLHGGPNAPMTAPALRIIIEGIRQRGLGFGTVSDVLQRGQSARAVGRLTTAQVLEPVRDVVLAPPVGTPPQVAMRMLREREPVLRPPQGVTGNVKDQLLP